MRYVADVEVRLGSNLVLVALLLACAGTPDPDPAGAAEPVAAPAATPSLADKVPAGKRMMALSVPTERIHGDVAPGVVVDLTIEGPDAPVKGLEVLADRPLDDHTRAIALVVSPEQAEAVALLDAQGDIVVTAVPATP